MRREKSLRIGVHHANAVVWEPVYRTHLGDAKPPDESVVEDAPAARGPSPGRPALVHPRQRRGRGRRDRRRRRRRSRRGGDRGRRGRRYVYSWRRRFFSRRLRDVGAALVLVAAVPAAGAAAAAVAVAVVRRRAAHGRGVRGLRLRQRRGLGGEREREREKERQGGASGRGRRRPGLLISESEQREVYFPRALVSATARGISPRGSRDLRPRGKTRRTREDAPSSVYASSWRPSRAARRASLRRAGEATTGGRTDGITRVSGAFARGNDRGRASFMREIRGRGLARDAPARAPRPRNRCDAAAKAFSNVSSAMSSREARATRRTARRDASRTREGTRGDAPVASARGSGSEREWRRADDGVCGSANDGDGTAVSGGDRGRRARRRRARRRRARDVARRARTVAVATVSPLPCTLIRRRLKKPRGFRARARSPAASRVRARRRARGRERCLW